MSEYTKGEWIVEHGPFGTFDVEYRTKDDGGLICVCGTDKDSEANARLIAAAPDLLSACEVAVLALTHEPINPEDIEFIKQAITKAKR